MLLIVAIAAVVVVLSFVALAIAGVSQGPYRRGATGYYSGDVGGSEGWSLGVMEVFDSGAHHHDGPGHGSDCHGGGCDGGGIESGGCDGGGGCD